jgi:ABC-type uncharacterized transport system ATPase subunit
MSVPPPRLHLSRITKAYPGVVANDAVDLVVQPGEIHAVLGENGAGKSTLMKIIYGAVQPDSGGMAVDGRSVHLSSPQQARALGIAMVFQHFSLFESLTVAQNVWLGLQARHTLAEVTQMVADKAAAYHLPINPRRLVHTLSVGEMQRVEIIRALLANPRLLILDEPTSVLTPQAVQGLFGVLRQLADEGCSILYISHKLHEIRALCHRCTVLRAGRVSGDCDPRHESNASLSRMMIGAEPPVLPQRAHRAGDVVLGVHGLSLPARDPFGVDLQQVSLQVRAGEILGLAGVSGNGQRELLQALSGEDRRADAASHHFAGPGHRPLPSGPAPCGRSAFCAGRTPGAWRGAGAGTHAQHAAHPHRSGAPPGLDRCGGAAPANAGTGAAVWREGAWRGSASAVAVGRQSAKIHCGPRNGRATQTVDPGAAHLGRDVGAAAQIHGEILALRDAGCAVLVVSEELDELLALSDRLMVMARGRLSPALPVAEATVERIGLWMSGLWEGQEPGGGAASGIGRTEEGSMA